MDSVEMLGKNVLDRGIVNVKVLSKELVRWVLVGVRRLLWLLWNEGKGEWYKNRIER